MRSLIPPLLLSHITQTHTHAHTDGKRVSFSDKVIVTLSPATPLFPPTPVPDRLQQDDGNSLDGSTRPSDDQGWNKDGEEEEEAEEEEEEEEEECFDHDAGMDEHDLSMSKKNLMSDIAEENEEEEEEEEGSADDEEGKDDGEGKVGMTVAGNVGVKQQQMEGVKYNDSKFRPHFLLLLSIAILFMIGVASILRKQQSSNVAPPRQQQQKPTVAQVSFVPRGEKTSTPPKNKPSPPVDPAPEKKAPTVQTRAIPARSPKQKHWPFRKQQKWVEPEDPAVAAAKSRSQPKSSSPRGDVQSTPQKNVWHHVRDAMHRLLNLRMLGVLLGYTLLYSFLV